MSGTCVAVAGVAEDVAAGGVASTEDPDAAGSVVLQAHAQSVRAPQLLLLLLPPPVVRLTTVIPAKVCAGWVSPVADNGCSESTRERTRVGRPV